MPRVSRHLVRYRRRDHQREPPVQAAYRDLDARRVLTAKASSLPAGAHLRRRRPKTRLRSASMSRATLLARPGPVSGRAMPPLFLAPSEFLGPSHALGWASPWPTRQPAVDTEPTVHVTRAAASTARLKICSGADRFHSRSTTFSVCPSTSASRFPA